MIPPSTRIRAFVILFTALFVLIIFLVVADEVFEWAWAAKVTEMGQSAGRMIFTAAAITFVAVEGGPMLAHWIRRAEVEKAREEGIQEGREKGLQEGREEGLEEGQARMYQEWQSWRQELNGWQLRKEEAEAAGREFSEPPPPEPPSPRNP